MITLMVNANVKYFGTLATLYVFECKLVCKYGSAFFFRCEMSHIYLLQKKFGRDTRFVGLKGQFGRWHKMLFVSLALLKTYTFDLMRSNVSIDSCFIPGHPVFGISSYLVMR